MDVPEDKVLGRIRVHNVRRWMPDDDLWSYHGLLSAPGQSVDIDYVHQYSTSKNGTYLTVDGVLLDPEDWEIERLSARGLIGKAPVF